MMSMSKKKYKKAGGGTVDTRKEWAVRWTEFDRQDRLVTKEKIFKTQKGFDRFVETRSEKPNFNEYTAFSFPKVEEPVLVDEENGIR